MRIKPGYVSIAAVMATVFLMVIGNGLIGTLLPLRARLSSFSQAEIGFLGSAYFGGMLLGALIASRLIRRYGHIRAIAACMVLASTSTLALALYSNLPFWLALRFLNGFAFAGLYAGVESWLQGRSEDAIRGRVLGLYSVMQYAGWGVGTQIIGLGDPASFGLFTLAAIALSVAILPLVLIDTAPPPVPESGALRVMDVWRDSPIGFIGAVLIGLVNGPFWTITPVYGSEIGLSAAGVGTFMTMLTIGSALFQIPVGRFSDKMDRRKVLLVVCLFSVALELMMVVFRPHGSALMLFGIILGGAVATQYYVVAAHANDRAPAQDAVRISAALLLLYCIGAMLGPTTAALLMGLLGPSGLFIHNAVLHLVLAAFVFYRMMKRPRPSHPADGDALTFRPAP